MRSTRSRIKKNLVVLIGVLLMCSCFATHPETPGVSRDESLGDMPTNTVAPGLTHTPAVVPSPTPFEPVVSSSRIVAISAGGSFSLALREDGRVWVWGGPNDVGLPADGFAASPVLLEGLENIIAIDADQWRASVFVDVEGNIFSAGYPRASLVLLEKLPGTVMAKVEGDTIVALLSDGTVWVYGEDEVEWEGLLGLSELEESGQFEQLPVTGIVDIFLMSQTALFVREDGTFWLWGRGLGVYYQTINGDDRVIVNPPQQYPNISNIQAAAYGRGLMLLQSDGMILVDYPPIGPEQFLQDVVQIDASPATTRFYAVDSDGTLWQWGSVMDAIEVYESTPMRVPIPARVVAVSTGISHVLALDSDGTVWAWGYAKLGALGIGILEDEYYLDPIPVLRSDQP